MLNILIPLAGKSLFFDQQHYHYPAPLIEIAGKIMIERVVENLSSIEGEKRLVFVVNEEDCRKYHIDDVLKLLVKSELEIVMLSRPTLGAACSCLMAIDFINNDDPLLISNGDQVLDMDLTKLLDLPSLSPEEAVVFCMHSVHPRWSYVLCEEEGEVVEVAEKRPISSRAIAGLYLYGRGRDFVSAAREMIKKGDNIDGKYYIAPALNQRILDAAPVRAVDVEQAAYHSFYTPERIAEYEEYLAQAS